ncbi:MAG: hypothetical protein LZF61_03365 [Nitrosomonas sp.]|nr:MAG: hypothetical protein LZF61_03365 [Nitrosomonas sp.]
MNSPTDSPQEEQHAIQRYRLSATALKDTRQEVLMDPAIYYRSSSATSDASRIKQPDGIDLLIYELPKKH